ncbi:hypothetical protein BH10ACI2_BH10ACI2_08990 [soil metagenome]
MMNNFTEFQGGPNPNITSSHRLRVTLNRRGAFLLNRHVHAAMGRPLAAKLLFDAENRMVALKPADPALSNAFPVFEKDKSQNHRIQASPFCKHAGIEVTGTIVFNEAHITREGALILDLKKTSQSIRVTERA